MIAGVRLATNNPVYAGVDQTLGQHRAQQKVVQTQPGIPCPTIMFVVPEGIDRAARMPRPNCVGPALIQARMAGESEYLYI